MDQQGRHAGLRARGVLVVAGEPREPLFGYGRCLAHFAVDPEQVFVTTALVGPKTRFLPFNQGRFGGA